MDLNMFVLLYWIYYCSCGSGGPVIDQWQPLQVSFCIFLIELLYSFPGAAAPKYHKLDDLEQQKCIII